MSVDARHPRHRSSCGSSPPLQLGDALPGEDDGQIVEQAAGDEEELAHRQARAEAHVEHVHDRQADGADGEPDRQRR